MVISFSDSDGISRLPKRSFTPYSASLPPIATLMLPDYLSSTTETGQSIHL